MARMLVLLLTLVTAAVLSGCVQSATDPPSSSPDPGGRILSELQTAVAALPADATVIYRNDVEPHWDSCDGRPGTFGWDNVVVQIHFSSPSAPAGMFANAVSQMTARGWTVRDRHDYTDLVWTRQLRNGTEAKAQLSEVGGWTIYAFAPPIGPRASGC